MRSRSVPLPTTVKIEHSSRFFLALLCLCVQILLFANTLVLTNSVCTIFFSIWCQSSNFPVYGPYKKKTGLPGLLAAFWNPQNSNVLRKLIKCDIQWVISSHNCIPETYRVKSCGNFCLMEEVELTKFTPNHPASVVWLTATYQWWPVLIFYIACNNVTCQKNKPADRTWEISRLTTVAGAIVFLNHDRCNSSPPPWLL